MAVSMDGTKKAFGTALVCAWTAVLVAPVLLVLFILTWPLLSALGIWH